MLVAEDDPAIRSLLVQLSAYVKASCELPHYDRRRSRIVDAPEH
ncbi:MAG: hypothetical protein ACXW31_09240 [Thermoanaerobaculia bacterium]